MSKMIETLKNNGWFETTLGECQVGDEVVVWGGDGFKVQAVVESPKGADGFVQLSIVGNYSHGITALRAPRPEYKPGTVALVTWDGQDEPMRAMRLNEDWAAVDDGYVLEGSAEVVRVLLPADQDAPAVEVTDEMVERAAKARYLANYKGDTFSWEWEELCERFPDAVYIFRRNARATLKAALENEKEK